MGYPSILIFNDLARKNQPLLYWDLMKKPSLYRITVAKADPIDPVCQLLESAGFTLLWTEEGTEIDLIVEGPSRVPSHPNILRVSSYQMPEIDWEDQWRTHAPGYQDGRVEIPLENAPSLWLRPGAGFGDCSHPTTRLMLTLLKAYVRDQTVLDIGCGSGILSLAAVAYGAQEVWGIDIDPDALTHARQNLEENPCSTNVHFLLPSEPCPANFAVALMNMIASEQEQALRSLGTPVDIAPQWICSGILKAEYDDYIALWQTRGFTEETCVEEEGWVAVVLKKKECPE